MRFTFTDLKPVTFTYPSDKLKFKNSQISFNTGLQCNLYDFFNNTKDLSLNSFNALALTQRCKAVDMLEGNKVIETTVELYLRHTDNEGFFLKSADSGYVESSNTGKSLFTFIKSNDFTETSYYIIINDLESNKHYYMVVDEESKAVILKDINLISNLTKESYNFNIRFLADNKCTIQTLLTQRTYLTINKKLLTCNSVYLPDTNYDTAHIFKYETVFDNSIVSDISKTNSWVSYYMSLSDRNNNDNLKIYNEIDAPCEYLLSFDVDDALNKTCKLDTLTLKTNFYNNDTGQNIPYSYNNINNNQSSISTQTEPQFLFSTSTGNYFYE